MEALNKAAYILNLVPTKSAPKTPYEMWTRRKVSFNYLCVWGCPTEAQVLNPQIKKLDPKMVIAFLPDTLIGERDIASIVQTIPLSL